MPINMPATHQDRNLKCIHCKWFHIGFEGKTCRVTRQVEGETQACIEFQHFRASPYDVLTKDKFLREMERNIQIFSDEYLETISQELGQYKLSKGTKLDFGQMASEEKLIELAQKFETCQAYTDRVIEIKNQLNQKGMELQRYMKDAQGYIFSHFTEQARGLKNEAERGMFYRNAMPSLFHAIEKLDTVVQKAQTIHQNLKDQHFSMCQTQDACTEVWKARVQSLVSGQRSQG